MVAAVVEPARTHSPAAPLLRTVIVGSVDDGKSTLLGRLLYECDGLAEDQIAAVRKKSATGAIDFSLFGDGLLAEREQGITIDVAWRYLRTNNLTLVLADTPGHVQYTRNMATGASAADAAIILVDARQGVLPQTRRHARIAALMGVRHVVVALNKVDLLAEETRATAIGALERDVLALLDDTGITDRAVLPVSAVRGDNITRPAADPMLRRNAHGAPLTVLSFLEGVPARRRASSSTGSSGLRLPVQLVVRPDLSYRGYAGTIAAGRVRPGDDVVVLPSGARTAVVGIDTLDGPLTEATAGQAVVVRLRDNVDVARGDVIAHADADAPTATSHVVADLVWLSDRPLTLDDTLLIKAGHRAVSGRVAAVLSRTQFSDGDDDVGTATTTLAPNDVGRVRLELLRPLVFDRYGDVRDTGAFIIIDPRTNETVAGGMVVDVNAQPSATTGAAPLAFAAHRAAVVDHVAPTLTQMTPSVSSVSPLSTPILQALHALDGASLQWISGYAAGLAAARGSAGDGIPAVSPAIAPAVTTSGAPAAATAGVTVLYATQTGHSQRAAARVLERLRALGAVASVASVAGLSVKKLAALNDIVFITSTHGDGDPPDDLKPLYDALHKASAQRLTGLRFSVIGLGDSSYPRFCQTAADIDARLSALGAERTAPLTLCDVDVDAGLAPFLAERARLVVDAAPRGPMAPTAGVTASTSASPAPPLTILPQPVAVTATVQTNQRLTARGTTKDVRHLELTLPSHVRFTPGDALLVFGTSHTDTVRDVVTVAHLDPAEIVTVFGQVRALSSWLATKELTRLSAPLVRAHAARCVRDADRAALIAIADDGAALAAFAKTRQVTDLLLEYPGKTTAQELVESLRPLQPRAYSLANSLRALPGEAHLTVAIVDDGSFPRRRRGALSGLLADSSEGATLTVEVQENPRFRLPDDNERDVIFIGPGTGIAPFRAFLQERTEVGARGRHWLFFGEQTLASHFLYQREWSEAKKAGTLHRLDVAFSRDQAAKVYVQHRIAERSADLWAWLESGAYLYVCGDATRMAKDVEKALVEVAKRHGAMSDDDADAWLAQLSADRRYQKDVY